MPPEISGHSSLPLHCFAPPLCNVSQLFLQKRLERTLDDLHKGTSFICKRTNYGQIFGFQRNTSKFEMVKHMLRIVSACYCGQKEKRCAKRLIAVSQRLFQRNDRKTFRYEYLVGVAQNATQCVAFSRFKQDSHSNEVILDFI